MLAGRRENLNSCHHFLAAWTCKGQLGFLFSCSARCRNIKYGLSNLACNYHETNNEDLLTACKWRDRQLSKRDTRHNRLAPNSSWETTSGSQYKLWQVCSQGPQLPSGQGGVRQSCTLGGCDEGYHLSKYGQLERRNVFRETQKQLWQELFSSPAEWWDNRLGKKGPRHPDFRHKRSGAALWLSNRYKPVGVGAQLASLDAQVRSGLGGPGFSYEGASGSDDEIERLCQEGQLEEALDALVRMDQENTVPAVEVYRSLLKLCTKRRALAQAKRVHAHLARHGLEFTSFLGESVVKTLVKCGSLADGLHIFNRLPSRTVVSWTAVISGHLKAGQGLQALRLYKRMQAEGVQPNTYTFVSLLQSCVNIANLEEGIRIHAEAVKYLCDSDLLVGTSLVDMYAKCGGIENAQKVFDRLPQRDVVSWNAMLTGYAQHGEGEQALQLYIRMLKEGVRPNDRTFVSVIQACGSAAERDCIVFAENQSVEVEYLKKGKAIHAEAWRRGYESDVFVGNALVSMYAKCDSIMDAWQAFDRLSLRDVVSWNAMITAVVQSQAERALELYEQMLQGGVSPDCRSFVTALQACGNIAGSENDGLLDGHPLKLEALQRGKEIHCKAMSSGGESDVFVGNALVNMYGKCGSIMDALYVFDKLMKRDKVSWNAMLAAYVQQDQPAKALELYEKMLEEHVSTDDRTFVSVLQACASSAERDSIVPTDRESLKVQLLKLGKAIHAEAWRQSLLSDVFVCSTLISMYAKCGSIVDAQNVFQGLVQPNVVSWTAMLTAHAQHIEGHRALQLYQEMQEEGISPNAWTFASVLQACGSLAESAESDLVDGQPLKLDPLQQGKAIHQQSHRMGYGLDIFVGSSIISMYGKCGSLMDAENVFNGLPRRNVVPWNAIIAAYVQQGQGEKALHLHEQMLEEGVSPNDTTILCILQACGYTGALDLCIQIHHNLLSTNGQLSPPLANTLISTYGKCARMEDARHVIDALPQPDVTSWNALIAGYARQGNYETCFHCYDEMQAMGVQPDEVTFLALFFTCSHAGMMDRGVEYFKSMTGDHGILPQIEHYVSMVDLLSRAGHFALVEDLLENMPMQPNLSIWLCLLGACQKHGNVVLGKRAFDSAISLQPKNASIYVLMSNIYAHAGMGEYATQVEELRQERGAWKKPGQSWIEHEQRAYAFMVADRKHPQQGYIYDFVQSISQFDAVWTLVN